jgi:DUF1680 family protein
MRKLTRRGLLRRLGDGAVAAIAVGFTPVAYGCAARNGSGVPARPSLRAPRLSGFRPGAVRLLPGPFLRAERLNERYLLQLEPDRLLHNFRRNASLQPKAPVYGGWESQEPWVEIRCHGHTLGHYLSACSATFAATGDQRFKDRVDYIVSELRECQRVAGAGLICAFPDGATQLEASLGGKPFVGVPWYTLHKIFAGLRDAFIHVGNRDALLTLRGLTEWVMNRTQMLTETQMQKMLNREHGGMAEVLADVHRLTGEKRHLELAETFVHHALFRPLSEARDVLDGLHSNTQIPKVTGLVSLYELNGSSHYRLAAEYFWRIVTQQRSFATGGNGDGEHFFPPKEFAKRITSAKTMETCCTHNLLRLTRALFRHDPDALYADYYERALYNGILASQDPDSGMMTYFQATRPGYVKLYCTPFDSFWCCTGSGMENHATYGDSIYFHDAESLYVNLFIPSELKWEERGVTVTQATEFPRRDTTRLTVRLKKPQTFALRVRHPGWCTATTIRINGRHHTVSHAVGTYVEIRRKWRDGDTVDILLPMSVRTEPLPGEPNIVAVLFGPIVLAGRLGSEGITEGADQIRNERTSGDMLNPTAPVPSWIGQPQQMASQIQRADPRSLVFRVRGFENGQEIALVPYYQIAHERYNLYWRVRAE